jgi:hypothetical protein
MRRLKFVVMALAITVGFVSLWTYFLIFRTSPQ